jgi:Core-2/I-Branching enzyme
LDLKGKARRMNKIAVLVLAANAPKGLSLLAEALGDPFSLYVHVDNKVDIEAYKGAADWSRVTFIANRVDVFWAGFNMIEATLGLMEAASAGDGHSHYCLISDDTFPLSGPDRLANCIRQSSGDWIQTWKVPEDHLFQSRYSRFFYLDSKFSSPRWFLTEDRALLPKDVAAIAELEGLRARGKVKLNGLFCGKQWWILSHEVVRDMIRFHHSHDEFKLSFKYSAVSDETYFQTMYRLLHPSRPTERVPIFDDFTREPKPFQFTSPEELAGIKEFETIRAKVPFFRKLRVRDDIALSDIERVLWSTD